jgi:uncharacterized protein YndB with AHSA1/START domain
MSTKVEKNVVVDVPLSTVYNQWTQFEDFPHFMNGVQSVTQLGADRLQWVAELGGVRRQWEAKIVEQVPDSRVSWAATEGATNAGTVTFRDAGNGRTEVHLVLEYEPEGLVEKVGDKLNVVENQAEGDLERFKKFIEAEGYATGAWRGSVNEGAPVGTPGVEHAAASRGDEGKAGVSGKAVAAGVAAAGVAAAGVAAAAKSDDAEEDIEAGTPVEAPLVEEEAVSEEFTTLAPAAGTEDTATPVTPTEPPTAYDAVGPAPGEDTDAQGEVPPAGGGRLPGGGV